MTAPPTTTSERDQIVARLSDLQAKQEAATGWGAAVGAREEEIRSLESRLLRIDYATAPPSTETPRRTSSGNKSAFDICEMIISEEFHLDEENPPSPAIQQYGYAARDRIRAAKREVCGGVAQGAPDQRLTEDMTLAHNARKTAIEECARVAEKFPIQIYNEDHSPLRRSCKPSTFEDIADAIRALSAVTPSPGAGEWQPIETAPGRIREFAKLRQNTIPRGPVVQLGGSLEDGSLYLFGHHALTHEVQQWIVIPALYCRPMDALSVPSTSREGGK